jgi:hypothetical protein
MQQDARRNGGLLHPGLVAAAWALLAWTGCQTSSPSGARVVATVTIEGRSLSEIRLAALGVFQQAGYGVASAFGRQLVFERRASQTTDILFGGWNEPKVWLRAKVRIEELKPGVHALDCTVFRVSDRGDSVLEEEKAAYAQRKGPFKDLLARIKARLDALPPNPEAPAPSPAAIVPR